MRPTTYSLQFRGFVAEHEGGLQKHGRAPGCALVTSVTDGLEGHFVWATDESEALFESRLAYTDDGSIFEECGSIRFAHGHSLHLRGSGQLAVCADPQLRHGTVMWEIVGGDGRFEVAQGRVTSNFLVSDTGDLTETQLGVIFGVRPGDGPGMSLARA